MGMAAGTPAGDPGTGTAAGWGGWSAVERQSFLEVAARHRRAAWRVTAACAVAALLMGLIASVLLAPVLFCAVLLLLDLVNLAVPVPDLPTVLRTLLQPLAPRDGGRVPGDVLLLAVAALPGLLLLAFGWHAIGRALRRSAYFCLGEPSALGARPPDRDALAERRVANTVEEMAVAAALPAPRVLIVDGGPNAAAIGRDEAHATVLVGSALLALPRAQVQGVAAHAVGSIANGDMAAGLRVARLLAVFGLLAQASDLADARGLARALAVAGRLLLPTPAGARRLLEIAAQPPGGPATPERREMGWRGWLLFPVAAPMASAGLFCALAATFLLAPLVALAWRERKLMADATAVRLTREPSGLAGALSAVRAGGGGASVPPWAVHAAVVDAQAPFDAGAVAPGERLGAATAYASARRGKLLGGSILGVFPPLAARLRALARMGAPGEVVPDARRPRPWWHWLVLAACLPVPCVLIPAVAVALAALSLVLSGFFVVAPAVLLHQLLRALA